MRTLRHLRDLWVLLGVTLLFVLLLNGALRKVLPGGTAEPAIDPEVRRPSKQQADAYEGSDWPRQYFRELDIAGRMRWESYTYWSRAPFEGQYINIDERGRRRTWNPVAGDDGRSVWVFGGSTVWGIGTRDDHTLPSELSRLLADEGFPVRVTNFGESGFVGTQEVLTLLLELQRGARPDVVVFYDGVNDVYAALLEGVAGIPMNEVNRRREFGLGQDWGTLFRASVHRLEGLRRLAAILRGRPAPVRSVTLAADVVSHYESNARSVRALAEAYDFDVLFFWQPTVFTKRRVTDFERRTRDSRMRVHRDLQLEANRLIEGSEQLGSASYFVNLTHALDGVEEPIYIDFCHLSEQGNRLAAQALLPSVVELLVRP